MPDPSSRQLVVTDGLSNLTDWAVRIEEVLPASDADSDSPLEAARWPESW